MVCATQVKLCWIQGEMGARSPLLYLLEPPPKYPCVKRLPIPLIITYP